MLDDDRRNRLRDNADTGFDEVQSPPPPIGPDDLAGIRVPALVIAGTESHPSFRSISERLAAGLADARFVEIDSGHVPYLEVPDTFAHTVSAFAAEIEQARATTP
jgi:3-oxoadipate enol-lactonase